ncbi:antibiotic biosynthesis monooxygenase [Haloactinopolyspora alba]|uniref:Antibiotic biosynthesis monooxygenase n=2 Tax=Haloactinopolyspora alba TaxID=648780 RepID=A0A2P8EBV9_9ACTN|nr:antibiotic biosynthesis monooxygenase family protein [Haloactinopolyspora alba]PSL06955.1 antibiotic biosynthesis monooxygenase [Haloactinopolyspora alba]
MLVVTRYRVPPDDATSFRDQAHDALVVLSQQPGWLGGQVGRATDDPEAWVISTVWRDVGSYRRALSAYDVKVGAVPLLSRAIDEPTAYEVLAAVPAGGPGTSGDAAPAGVSGSARASDADEVGLGSAAAPTVRTDTDAPEPGRQSGRPGGSGTDGSGADGDRST